MSEHSLTVLFLALAALLAAARLAGELARRFGQPAILGEIVAGIVLGPSMFGLLAPDAFAWLFRDPQSSAVRGGFAQVAVCLFMFVAGLEVDLKSVLRRGRTAAVVSLSGIAVPFAVGLAAAWSWPSVLGGAPGVAPNHFALFFATALSISALPVIARTLMDLGLYRSDLGMVVISAAIVEDLAGWIIFAIILGLIGGDATGQSVATRVGLVVLFTAGMLTVGRWLLDRLLPYAHAYLSWPGGVLGAVFTLALVSAACTQAIGVHALFGAFIAGVALGDSRHLRAGTRGAIEQPVAYFFAPIFFASIGLRVDIVHHFDPLLVGVVLAVACIGKVLGCGLGARWSGSPWRESWAIGVAMNSRGAMEIVLGLLALEAGLIGEPMFVALVVMALVTSLISGPLMQRLLARPRQRRVVDALVAKAFIPRLAAGESASAIAELAAAVSDAAGTSAQVIAGAVAQREAAMATGVGDGLAIPHAVLVGLTQPLIAVGLSQSGIDFAAPDGKPARVVALLLTPAGDEAAQHQLVAELARAFAQPAVRDRAPLTSDYTEFRALLRAGE